MAQVGEKRTVEGLAVGPGRYRVTEEEIKDRFNYSWRVDPGVDLNRDSVWEMNMTVRHDQLVRFPQECMFLKFMAKSPNVDYVSDTAGDVDGKYVKLKIGFTQPMDNKPPVYFDGTLGASVFFEKIEVLVNGVPVPDTQGMSSYGFIYAAMNKIYCSEKHRKEKYLREIYRVSNDVDGHIPSEKVAKPAVENKPQEYDEVPGEHSADMDACMELLQFEDQQNSTAKLSRFSMDGVWPFDFQCNLLMALTKEEKYNGFLYPGLRLTLRFHKRNNINSLLEKPSIRPQVYYDKNTKVATPNPHEVLTFEIKDFSIEYEAVTLKSQEKMDRGKRGGKWYYDSPSVVPQSVEEGKMLTVNIVQVPKGAKVVVLTWMCFDELFFNESQGKHISPRFHFIPHAVNVKIAVEGAQANFMFPEGFKDVGTGDAHNSNTLRVYHDYLTRMKLYSKPFDKFVPQGSEKGRDQSFIVSFTNERLKNPTTLNVTVEYNDTMSPKGWYLVATIVEQHELTYYDKQEVKSVVVV